MDIRAASSHTTCAPHLRSSPRNRRLPVGPSAWLCEASAAVGGQPGRPVQTNGLGVESSSRHPLTAQTKP